MSIPDAMKGDSPSDPSRPDTFIHPSQRKTYDPDVSLEEYIHYAKITRQQEEEDYKSGEARPSFLQSVFRRGPKATAPVHRNSLPNDEKTHSPDSGSLEKEQGVTNGHDKPSRRGSRRSDHMVITEDEWQNASRAFRTASWGAGFYLITTGNDINYSKCGSKVTDTA